MKLPRTKLYINFTDLIKTYFKILFGIELTKGKKTLLFENLLENYWRRKKCFTLSTCRLALYYVLKSLNLKKGDEVLLTPLQIPDFLNIILSLDLKPIFVDIDNDTKSVNLLDLTKKISSQSKVLLATYLTGILPNIYEIKKICEKNKIALIEDISQSYGSKFNNISAGSFGYAAIGSLSPAKIISSIGGGFILIDDPIKIKLIENLLNNDLSLPSKRTLLNICFFQIKVSLATSKYIFSFFTYYIFLFLSKFYKKKFKELHNPTFKYLHKDQTIYDNPAISRKLPQEFYFYFTDLQADLAIKTFNQNIKYGLSKRQSLAKILYENLNSNSRKYVPDLVQQYDNNCYWHFPIIPTQNLSNKFQKYLMGKGYDVVGYGLKLCSEDLNFVERNSNLIGAKNIHANTLFLPLFESLKPKEIIKIAKDINIFFDNR